MNIINTYIIEVGGVVETTTRSLPNSPLKSMKLTYHDTLCN